MTVSVTRQDHTASDLRSEAARSKDAAYARRTLALALVLEGTPRRTAAETCGMDRQTLRDRVHRYNAEGLCARARTSTRTRWCDGGSRIYGIPSPSAPGDAARAQCR